MSDPENSTPPDVVEPTTPDPAPVDPAPPAAPAPEEPAADAPQPDPADAVEAPEADPIDPAPVADPAPVEPPAAEEPPPEPPVADPAPVEPALEEPPVADEPPVVEPPPPPFKAIIDAKGVLVRFERTEADGVMVPEDCDLAPGKYRWVGKHWVPILSEFKTQEIVGQPDAMLAIYLGFKAIRDGKNLPPLTLAWIEAYGKTIDAQGM
jgi:hypothetical protein